MMVPVQLNGKHTRHSELKFDLVANNIKFDNQNKSLLNVPCPLMLPAK